LASVYAIGCMTHTQYYQRPSQGKGWKEDKRGSERLRSNAVCDDIRCFADDAFREINGGNARAPRDVEEPDVDADADMEGGRGRGLRSDSSNCRTT
jgi:hypothetical protein